MSRLLEWIIFLSLRFLISLRYRIVVRGTETLPQKKGLLFLANHPAEIDPLILVHAFWKPFKPHPVAIDYLFRKPLIRSLLDLTGALPIPNFDGSSNSFKRKTMERTYQRIFSYLDRGENLLIYPAGGLKHGPEEKIGGASGVHVILAAKPETHVVLVRTTGLWGSSFSRAPTGQTPDLVKAFMNGFKVLLRNGIFFAPRREILIECCVAPEAFPRKGSKKELNHYLENWYNAKGPEPLNLVSFSRFKKVYPSIKQKAKGDEIALDSVSEEIKQLVLEEIAKLTRQPLSSITIASHLSHDLSLDSLDIAQLVVVLKEQFGITSLHSNDLTTVGSVIAFAAKLKVSQEEEKEGSPKLGSWDKEKNRPPSIYPSGTTVCELFFKTCDRMKGHIACIDQLAGEISYNKLKMGVCLLAESIRKLPGEKIGIMLPASVGVNALVLATILAKKIPVMINWTLGERNLKSVVEQSQIEVTLSSWNFLDKLDNVELNGVDDHIILLEELRRDIKLFAKIKALFLSEKRATKLVKHFKIDKISEDETAVILFTSGTESFPKGVPLSHKNLIKNQRGAYSLAEVSSTDVLLGALPPFHSFGFSVTGLFPLLAGLRVAYSPNPTDGKRIAEAIERWKITLLCLAPTFIKNLFRVATPKQLHTLRLVVAGAEKTAAELYEKLSELNPHTKLIEGYGITECAPIITLNPPQKKGTGVGLPLPEVELLIIDPETKEPLALGQQGLILTRGPNIFGGYLDPTLSSPFVLINGKEWYNTGDLGFLDKEGFLTLSGRLKRFIKIGGEMVSLAAIEETLNGVAKKRGWKFDPDIPSMALCAFEQEGRKGEIHLFTTFDVTVEEINQILRESGMSNIIKIRSVRKLPYIPLLGTGKIDYRKLTSRL